MTEQDDRIARLEDVQTMSITYLSNDSSKSLLVGSLLTVPSVMPMSVAASLMRYSRYEEEDVPGYFQRLVEEGSTSVVGAVRDRENFSGSLDEAAASALDKAEFAVDEPGMVAAMDGAVDSVVAFAAQMSTVALSRLMYEELRDKGPEVTVGRLVLAAHPQVRSLAQVAFPCVVPVLEELGLECFDLAPKAATTRTVDPFTGTAVLDAGEFGVSTRSGARAAMMFLEATYDDDPDMIAAFALDTPGACEWDRFQDILDDASPNFAAMWLHGMGAVTPRPGEVKAFMEARSDEQVAELAYCTEKLKEMGHEQSLTPWTLELIEYGFFPDIALDPVSAAYVYAFLEDEFGDDYAVWTAFAAMLTTEEMLRLDDLR